MADIAQLGFAVDTAGLEKGKAALSSIVPAAVKAESATGRLEAQFSETGMAAERMAAGVTKSGAALNSASAGANAETSAVNAASQAIERKTGWVSRLIERLRALSGVSAKATSDIKRVTAAANDNPNVMRANVGNIAAQFQDIGVTAAMGMSPLMIALQQGTQLSAVFASTGQSAFKTIAGALSSVLSPVSLLTIGLVGLAAAGLQMIDWTGLAKSALNTLADILPTVAVYAAGLAAGLALIYAPAILTGFASLIKAVYALAAGLLATIGIPALIVAGLVAVVAAANYFRDDLTQIFGVDIVASAKSGVNFIVGSFVGAYYTIRDTWSQLPAAVGDAAIQAANAVGHATNNMVNQAIGKINSLLTVRNQNDPFGSGKSLIGIPFVGGQEIANPYKGTLGRVGSTAQGNMSKAQGKDWVGGAVGAITEGGRYLAGKLRSVADGLGGSGKKKKDKADRAAGGKTDAEKFSDITEGVNRDIKAVEADIAGINLTADAALRLKNEQKLLNEANQKGLKLTADQTAELKKLAGSLTDLQIQLEHLKGFKELTDGADKSLAALKAENAMIGLTGQALATARYELDLMNLAREKKLKLDAAEIAIIKEKAAQLGSQAATNEHDTFMNDVSENAKERAIRLREERDMIGLSADEVARLKIENELLAQARQKNIDLSPTDIEAIKAVAAAQAGQENEIRKMKDALDFAKSTARGFFDDLKSNLEQGKGFWRSWGDAILGVLDRIIEKLSTTFIDSAIDNLFKSVGGAFGGGFGGGVGGNGGGFGGGGATAGFAKGGVFTNSVVGSPTLFRFAKGAAMGVMGEAGPEAVMPLKRGSNGSLGVQMHGGNNRPAAPSVNNVHVENKFTLSGALSSRDIVEMQKAAAEKTKSDVKQSLVFWLDQYQRDGAIAA